MALTTDEKAYIKRLRQAGADDENVLHYLKQRRSKESMMNQKKEPGVIGKVLNFAPALGQGLVTGTIRGVGNIAKFGGNIIDKALPGDYLKRGTEALQRGTEAVAGTIEEINPELTSNVGQNIGQFGSNLIGGAGLVKGGANLLTRAGGFLGATKTGANILSKAAPIVSQLGRVSQYAKGTTLGAKAANLGLKAGKWGAIGGVETAGYDVASRGEISPKNVAVGSIFSAMLPVAGVGLKKLAGYTTGKLPQTLQLQGLMNPAKVTMLKNKLMTEGTPTPQDLGKWMLDRGIKGDKETIIKTLLSRADDSKQAVDDTLASIRGTISSPTAKKALQQTYNDLSKIAGLEDEAQNVLNMLRKDKYTLTELNKVKRILDDLYNLYTKTGDPTAGMKAKGLQNIRSTLRKTIEDEAEKLGITNIRSLNNETQIAKGMADAISRKDSADAVREALTAFAPSGIGGVAGGFAGPFDKNTPQGFVGNVLVGILAGRALGSTKLKTNVASLLNKLSKQEIGALDAYIRSGGKTALTPKIIQTMDDTLKLLPPASGKPLSANVVDLKPMTGFSPGRMQAQQSAVSSKVGTQPLTTATQQSSGVSGITPLLNNKGIQQKILPKAPYKKVNDTIIPTPKPKAKLKTNADIKPTVTEGRTLEGFSEIPNSSSGWEEMIGKQIEIKNTPTTSKFPQGGIPEGIYTIKNDGEGHSLLIPKGSRKSGYRPIKVGSHQQYKIIESTPQPLDLIQEAKKYKSAEEFVKDIGIENIKSIEPFSDNYIVIGGPKGLSKRAMAELDYQLGNSVKGDPAYAKVVKEMLDTPKEKFIEAGRKNKLENLQKAVEEEKLKQQIKKETEERIKKYGKDAEKITTIKGFENYFKKRGFKAEIEESNKSLSTYLYISKKGGEISDNFKIRFSNHPYWGDSSDLNLPLSLVHKKEQVKWYEGLEQNLDNYDIIERVFRKLNKAHSKSVPMAQKDGVKYSEALGITDKKFEKALQDEMKHKNSILGTVPEKEQYTVTANLKQIYKDIESAKTKSQILKVTKEADDYIKQGINPTEKPSSVNDLAEEIHLLVRKKRNSVVDKIDSKVLEDTVSEIEKRISVLEGKGIKGDILEMYKSAAKNLEILSEHAKSPGDYGLYEITGADSFEKDLLETLKEIKRKATSPGFGLDPFIERITKSVSDFYKQK